MFHMNDEYRKTVLRTCAELVEASARTENFKHIRAESIIALLWFASVSLIKALLA